MNDRIFPQEQTFSVAYFPFCIVSGIYLSKTNNGPKIYPNPTTGLLNIEVENNPSYKVIDPVGKVVMEGKLETKTIDLSKLGVGFYRLVLTSDSETYSTNVVKQ